MTLDGFNEKKWFVYLGDHHEGPFSLADIQRKLSSKQMSSTSYAWKEGMTDWRMMNELSAFESLLHTAPAANGNALDGPSVLIDHSSPSLEPPSLPGPAGTARPHSVVTIETTANNQRSAATIELLSHSNKHNRQSSEDKRSIWGIVFKSFQLLVTLSFFGGLYYVYSHGYLNSFANAQGIRASVRAAQEASDPYLEKLATWVPPLANYVSPIPRLEDVTPEEYADLKIAARAQLDAQGPMLALAISNADVAKPTFYVASNLPEGSRFDVYVLGVPDTLLNQLWFASRVEASIKKKLGKTEVVRFPDGKPIPRGQYIVYVTAGENQPPTVHPLMEKIPALGKTVSGIPKNARVLLAKNYFLGGPKDEMYLSRLKDFHDKLMAKATGELAELKQYATSLDSQLSGTLTRFNELKRGKGKPSSGQKKGWGAFNSGWNRFNVQLGSSFAKWTPDAIQNQFFYGMLYQMTLSTAQAIQRLHTFQNQYFTGSSNPRAFEIQIGEATSFAQSAMTGLRAKLEQAEKIPPSPNGMPEKEGL